MFEEIYLKANCRTPSKENERLELLQTCAKIQTTDSSRKDECSTPVVSNSKENHSITSPIKKSKRRDCTPYFSPDRTYFSRQVDFFAVAKNLSSEDELSGITSERIDDNDESIEILSRIKGIIFFYRIEHSSKTQSIFQTILSDLELRNRIVSEISSNFFEGYNLRNKQFFKYINSIYTKMEIVDLPQNSFEENLRIIDANIKQFLPDYSKTQLDLNESENYFIFSVKGQCNFNLNLHVFILSLKIQLYLGLEMSDIQNLSQILFIDYVKLKVFN